MQVIDLIFKALCLVLLVVVIIVLIVMVVWMFHDTWKKE